MPRCSLGQVPKTRNSEIRKFEFDYMLITLVIRQWTIVETTVANFVIPQYAPEVRTLPVSPPLIVMKLSDKTAYYPG